MNTQATSPDNTLYITSSADNAYSMILATMLYSALVNLPARTAVEIFVMDGGISQTNRGRIEAILAKTPSPPKVHWITVDLKQFSHFISSREASHLNETTFMRLLTPDLVPAHVTKLLHLDCDMIVEANLLELWNEPLDSKPVGAVTDWGHPTFSRHKELPFEELGIAPETPYFNAGMMVMDLAQFRERKLHLKVLETGDRYRQYCYNQDQDALNATLHGQWKSLTPQWNVQVKPSELQTMSREDLLKRQDVNAELYHQACAKPYIIHFAGVPKPWHPAKMSLRDDFKPRFYHYLKRTGWFSLPKYAAWYGRLWSKTR